MNVGKVIAATRNGAEFDLACKSGVSVIFDLAPDINLISERLDKAHKAGKRMFIHIDLAAGIGKDESGILFLKKLGIDGIISTRVNIIKAAREHGIFTVQRFFIVDSHSVDTTLDSLRASKADMIEIMPGTVSKVIRRLCITVDTPIIAGGLIEEREEIDQATVNGATAVSTGKKDLWK